MSEILGRVGKLSPAKQMLFQQLLREHRQEAAGRTLVPVPRGSSLPLSFAQRRLWFLNQLEPGTSTYNLRVLLHLSGQLDHQALARSFREVVRRHESLRTVFREEAGVPVQVVLPHLGLDLPLVDLTAVPSTAREAESLAQMRELAARSFDLRHPPLLRIALVNLGGSANSEHHLLISIHHIVSDGWSMGVLVREIGVLYEEFAADRPSPLSALPIQYADFAVWQREWLTGETLEHDLGYWRAQLYGAADLNLPTDRQRPAVQSSRGNTWRFDFDAGLIEAIEALARREGATPFIVLAAGLFTMLARLSEQSDLSIGSPVAGRTRPEIEDLIGFFVNTLVFRVDVNGASNFLALLRHVREVVLRAFAHQNLPFEKLVAELAPERDMSRSPLFQVALAFQNAPRLNTWLPELEVHPVQLPVDNAKFDLAFIVGGESGSLSASLEYSTDLFDRTSAARLTEHWLRLLAAAAAFPDAPLETLNLLSPAERHQVVVEWNDTAAGFQRGALLHQLFEERAAVQPEAPAVVWEEVVQTYAQLETQANRLAHLLIRLGVRCGTPVGVWLERSHHMVAAVLGILKAGGTYLPLDAAWPVNRVEALLSDTDAPVLMADRATLPTVEEMRWRLSRLGDAVYLDVETPELPPEPLDDAIVQNLWDLISERAVDWITEAGFYSAYTGEPFSEAEVLEYRDRVVELAEPWLGSDAREKRVLEIGCGSGLILWQLAPRVGHYLGIDPSARTQERNRERAEREGYRNVELLTSFAHDIELLPACSFDLVILANTIQFFPGLIYLEKVLALVLSRLAPGGGLVIADVMDSRRREDFRRSLAEFAATHRARAVTHFGGRHEPRGLFVDEAFFADLEGAFPTVEKVRVLHRQGGFPNELRFRYDVVISKTASLAAQTRGRSKRVWTAWHVAQSPAERVQAPLSPVDIVYVIHTSGSTGQPKGIMVQHRPAVELCRWVSRSFGVGPGDRLLFITSPAFDLSVYDIFGVLGAGGTVHVASERERRDPEELVRLLVEKPITIWDSAPAALQQLTPLFPTPSTVETRLRLVLLSGDWIPVSLPDVVRASFTRAQVIGLGGATEATVWSNWFPVGEIDPAWPSIPYGRPITNARYHVLDRLLKPCPINVPGDLYIGGACLCVGYARLPELTAEKFIPDPFATDSGARLYATGDRARYGHDGNIEFLGRIDQQVKVRGFRIELEEIEAALARHPGVREAVVVAREDVPGDKRLVGYVVPTAWPAPSAPELRAALQQVMPEYMVPWTFLALESMPLTAHGKIDRKSLPAPQEMPSIESGYIEPRTEVERAVALIWQEVLGLRLIGLNDSFFDLGGSSLVAAQVISRVRAALAAELPLRDLFEHRTLAAFAQRIEELRGESAERAVPVLKAASRPVLSQIVAQLSFAQQRLWFIDQFEPGNPAYNVPFAVRLSGDLPVDLLARVFVEMVRRHETLRTTFALFAGQPMQVIDPSGTRPQLPLIDLSHLSEDAREVRARELAREEARRPFDLKRGPLMRLVLVGLGETDRLLLVTMHHIISDGWSMGVLLREVAALYAAFAQGSPSPLAELPVQYADFAVWQRSWFQGEVLKAQLSYWRSQLDGVPPSLELPTDRPRPSLQTFKGASRAMTIPLALTESVRGLCRREGMTPFMTLLAAWVLLLGRHARQEEVLVGAPVAGRNWQEIEDLIGFFVNTLVLRADLSGSPGFAELLRRVRRVALDAFAHQDLPFERVVEELVPTRDLSRSPLFQVLFVLQNVPFGRVPIPGLVLSPVATDNGLAKFDLSLALLEDSAGITGSLEYKTDLFDGTTVARWLTCFEVLLEAAVADPERPVAHLPLLNEAERHQLATEWNDTSSVFPLKILVHERIATWAVQDPGRVALSFEGEELTYAEMVTRVRQLAGHLCEFGVGPGVVVGVYLERSLDLVLALLAVLEAGGAYLPLDPAYPAERLSWMLKDSGAPVVLSHSRLVPSLLDSSAQVVYLDKISDKLARRPANPIVPGAGPDDLAYVIFTSGSTGRPKGVMCHHRGLSNRLLWMDQVWPIATGDRFLQKTPFNFDVSVWEIFGPLAAGARLVIARPGGHWDSAYLLEMIASEGITCIHFVPSMLQVFLEEAGLERCRALRWVSASGEVMPPDLLARFHARLPGVELLNLYGPTEAAIEVTAWPCRPGRHRGGVPIGRPIANITIHLIDQELRPVPIGVPGELLIGGVGVARGYMNRPELTAERFIPAPWSSSPGSRFYRTGDLARWLPDGVVEYLGRIDHQVKIRGFRIELGEIEAVLARHPSVRECVVLTREDTPGTRILVAYAARSPEARPQPAELRAFLAERLPEPMVPTLFVVLEDLPRIPNGKIDRKVLAALAPEDRAASTGPAEDARLTPVQEILASLWSEVLGCYPRPEDNFFSLGGDSILSIRIVARACETLNVSLTVRDIFRHQRLIDLAARTEELRRPEGINFPLPIRPVDRRAELPLSYAQERLWLLHQKEGGAAYNIPGIVRLRGILAFTVLAACLDEIVRRHEVLRTRFAVRNGRPSQVIDAPFPAPLPLVDLTALPVTKRHAEAVRLTTTEVSTYCDLATGPVFRARLLRLEPAEHRLVFTVHHIAFDGWSLSVLVRELTTLYTAFVSGRSSPLPELAVQYADYARWQRDWLTSEPLEQHLEFWRRNLESVPSYLDLPLDRPRPATPRFVGERIRRVIPPEIASRFVEILRQNCVTPYMGLLAVFGVLLSRLSGQEDLVVGSPVAERSRPETEPLIGVFLNTLALRLDLSREPTFAALLARVRESTLGVYAHQEFPFENLLAAIRSDRDSRSPLFQVFLNMLSFPRTPASLPGLRVETLEVPELPARFDLTLYATPQEDRSLTLDLVWNTDLFCPARATTLLEQLESLIEQAAKEPEIPIGHLTLITPGTLAVLPDSRRPLEMSWEGNVIERVRWWAAEMPKVVAVRDTLGIALTWEALEERSHWIGQVLSASGVGRGDVVAVWAHRSAGLPEALLGVWKAGAAFAILDPAYPAARLRCILRVAAPVAWIALAAAPQVPTELKSCLGEMNLRVRLDLPAPDTDLLPSSPTAPTAVVSSSDDLAWIAFTSGTTGEPKAILGTHAPLSHFLRWHTETFSLGPSDRFSLLSGLAHDPLLRDIFTPLWLGATLCIPDPEEMSTPGRLRSWMAEEHLTVVHLTPALVHWIADDDNSGRSEGALPELRRVFFGGDLLTRRDAARLAALAPDLLCANFYGTTETPQAMAFHVLTAEELGGGGRETVPLGRGIDGVQLLVLGSTGLPAGIGELGEIYVRTPYLSLGYQGDSRLTSARFLPDPCGSACRLYRTGDLGRYRPDGVVELVGRADTQLKVRGIRIEPAEVESALELHPQVQQVAVGAYTGADGERRIAAWLVPAGGNGAPSPGELQEWLRKTLPSALIPSVFMTLPALPLTPNSKIDRQALPKPVSADAEGADDAPRGALEAVLADLWTRILGLPAIGVHADFFALGGDSLVGFRLVARIEEELGICLPLRALFDNPTVATLAQEVERRRSQPGVAASRLPVIVTNPEARHLPFPLTDIQHAFWLGRSAALELGNVGSHRYLEIEGFDPERFGTAWRRLIERHDMLRAVVRSDGSQVILPTVPFYDLAVEDLRDYSADEAGARLTTIREHMSHQVLPTDRWPLFEIRACRLPDERVRIFFSFDYLIADAWSFHILIRELLALYSNPEAALPRLELSFRDYVLAETALRASERWSSARAYWNSRLDELPPEPELPLAKTPSAVNRPHFSRRSERLEPAAWSLLRERAAAAGVTPSALLLTAFSTVLAAWSKSPRFTIVLTLFNRLPFHPEVDLLIGDFTSTVLLAVDASPCASFRERAQHLQQRLWDDLDHRYFSGVQVLRRVAQGRGTRRVSALVVFTSTLGLRSLEGASAEPHLPGEVVFSLAQTPQVLLDHQVSERGGALLWSWDAVGELFPADLLDEMFAAYCRLLLELAEGDTAIWETAPRVIPPHHLALITAANDTAAPVSDKLLHQLFATQAETEPGRLAVLAPERTLSYQELRARSLDLGYRLRSLGARPNQLVAVVMAKGWEQIVAVLGILESGAAYLPIDASFPPERIRLLLAQGQVELVVTQESLDGLIAWPVGIRRVCVEATEPTGAPKPLAPTQRPEDLAYVIFTSGSAGIPKGVMIDHRGAVNTILDVNRRYAVGSEDRIFALSSLSFDLSVYDIFGLLAVGGALVLPAAAAQKDPAQWMEFLDRHRVTLWNSVPALLEMLIDDAEFRQRALPEALRVVLLSGDWMPLSLPARVCKLTNELELVSLGGATEASIWSILHPVTAVDLSWKSVPYGRPMVNQTVYALDEALEPRPVWVPGVLWIGGIGVARGYWHDPEKTAASFVIHLRTGERLYRTGDLGRLLPDGSLEILGREDFQIKVHGYRIEPGEIETVILGHPAVKEAVVQAWGEGPGRRLVAWVAPAEKDFLPLDEIRSLLRSQLPEYMIPSSFVSMVAFPYSLNNKLDRQALPAPPLTEMSRAPQAELSPLARRIISVIGRALQQDVLNLDADLFTLAGSVEMVRIAILLENEFGFRPRIEEIFTLSTVGALVEFYDRRLGDDDLEPAPDASRLTVFTPLADPIERERFKASEPGLRRLDNLDISAAISLSGSEPPSRYAARRSRREFSAAPVDTERLGRWLVGLRRSLLDGQPKYLYASAGALYPVQVYLYALSDRVIGAPAGPYYYHPSQHALIPLVPRSTAAMLHRGDFGWVNQPIFDSAAFALFLVGDLRAIGPIYGSSSRDFCLIEAGLMTQLLEERAARHGLGVCQVGRCRIETLSDLFLLESDHIFLHSLLGGLQVGAAVGAEEAVSDEEHGWEEGEI